MCVIGCVQHYNSRTTVFVTFHLRSYHSPLRRCSLAGVHSSSLPSSLVLRCRRGARSAAAGTDLDLTTFWVMNSGFFTARPAMYGTLHIQHKTDDNLILANMSRGDQLWPVPFSTRLLIIRWRSRGIGFYNSLMMISKKVANGFEDPMIQMILFRKYNQLHRRYVAC